MNKVKINKTLVIILLIIILITIGIVSCTGRVRVGENAMLINRFNGTTTLIDHPGYYFKLPIIETTRNVSIAEKTMDYNDEANTKDNIQLDFSSTITYKIEDATKLYNTKYSFDQEVINGLLGQELTKALDRVTNEYTYDEIKANVAKVGEEVTKEANEGLKATYGIDIISFSIKGIDAPESVEKAIQEKIAKQQEAEASEYEVEKAQNEAEAQKIKEDSVSQTQQQMELCQKAIEKGQSNSPSCYFGEGAYVTGQTPQVNDNQTISAETESK